MRCRSTWPTRNRLSDLLPRTASLAEVLRLAWLRTGQPAENGTGLPRSAVVANLSGTHRGGTKHGDQRDRRVLRRPHAGGSVTTSQERRDKSREPDVCVWLLTNLPSVS